jgi:hypothetical protein
MFIVRLFETSVKAWASGRSSLTIEGAPACAQLTKAGRPLHRSGDLAIVANNDAAWSDLCSGTVLR